ncbi:MAG: putative peptide-modifying radical SAM/SPASM domain-containing protein [Thermoprotei archaeon]|nr:MAG: putative peptide-modifying radical SAM/SPASM domain-containing protein [Thermoprotei archaeon]
MLYIVFTTGKCNLKCKYCGGSFDQAIVPWSVKYDPGLLKNLIEKDNDAIVALYGGEPLLNIPFVEWILENVRAKHFVIQTNGLLAKSLDIKYWKMFDAVLFSIDGREEITDKYRGKGVYRRAVENARWLRENGYEGDLIARMTVTEDSDIYLDVKHLLELGVFSNVHWQLDVVWSDRWKAFEKWRDANYIPGLKRLKELWVKEASRGKVLGIAPFKAVVSQSIWGVYKGLPCGSGQESVSILTDGRVVACPIAVYEKWAQLGQLGKVGYVDLIDRVLIGEPCRSCPYYRYCGGRCLYAYKERLWGEEGFKKVCKATKAFIEIVLETVPRFLRLLDEGIISKEELYYPPFNNTVEVIP